MYPKKQGSGRKGQGRCANCGYVASGERNDRIISGRCKPCYQYVLRTGRERPLRQSTDAPSCECGQPATVQLQVTVGVRKRTQIVLELCETCVALETER